MCPPTDGWAVWGPWTPCAQPIPCLCLAPSGWASSHPWMPVVRGPICSGWASNAGMGLHRWASPWWTNGHGSDRTTSNGPCWTKKHKHSNATLGSHGEGMGERVEAREAWARHAIAPRPGRTNLGWANGGVGANPTTPPASRWSSRRRARLSQNGYDHLQPVVDICHRLKYRQCFLA